MRYKVKPFSLLLFAAVLFLMPVNAQDLPYDEGSVWDISYIKTKPPHFEDYITNLSNGWVKVMDEAKKQGLILDYMVLSSSPSDKNDWDLMLMIEYKNMAALDNLESRMRKIETSMLGGESEQKTGALARNDIRELLGGRLAREIHIK